MTPAIFPGAALMQLVLLHPKCRKVWSWLPGCAPRGSILVGPDGTHLVVRADGGLDPVQAGGLPHAGIASDPTASVGALVTRAG